MIDGTVTIQDATVSRALKRLADATSDRRPALRAANRRLLTLVREGFRSGTDPWGEAWERLAMRSGQPLKDTGRLRNSFTGEATNDEAIVGTNVCYAVVHQFGATVTAGAPSGNNVCGYTPKGASYLTFPTPNGGFARKKSVEIPRRAMLPITESGQATLPDDWADAVIEEIQNHIESAL